MLLSDYMGSNIEGSMIQKLRRESFFLPPGGPNRRNANRYIMGFFFFFFWQRSAKGRLTSFIEGSKQQWVAWYTYASLVWCLKGTMIFFFKRMTVGLSQRRLVDYIGYGCLLTYVAVISTVRRDPCPPNLPSFLFCSPLHLTILTRGGRE